jgi:hypothetical protein
MQFTPLPLAQSRRRPHKRRTVEGILLLDRAVEKGTESMDLLVLRFRLGVSVNEAVVWDEGVMR